MVDEEVRTFIAIELPAELKISIGKFQAKLKNPKLKFIRWVNPELMHITLKFLGNQSLRDVEKIKEVIEKRANSINPFSLTTGETGCFPNIKNVRVFWLGINENAEQLVMLHKSIDDDLVKQGFAGETRPFAAHLTIARVKDGCSLRDRIQFAEIIKKERFTPCCSINVDRILLMKSMLTPNGPVYSQLAECRLGK